MKSVCIIGAGLSGLITAKVMKDDGFAVHVYEKGSHIGGVWSPENAYPSLRTQAPSGLYTFSDEPQSKGFETAEEKYQSLLNWSKKNDVLSRVSFNTQVIGIQRDAKTGMWTVTFQPKQSDGSSNEPFSKEFDHVVIATGAFNIPRKLSIDGESKFSGKILHSSEVTEEDMKGKRVVIVGYGKSGMELSVLASKISSQFVHVFRDANWAIPMKIMGGNVPHEYVFYSRISAATTPIHPNIQFGFVQRAVHSIPNFLKLYWNNVEQDVVDCFGLKSIPDHISQKHVLGEGFQRACVAPPEYYPFVKSGKIKTIKSEIDSFISADEIKLKNGQTIQADVVVCATGWKIQPPFGDLVDPSDIGFTPKEIRLYRNIVPTSPKYEGLGFVGYLSALDNALTSEISANWLSDWFQGNIKRPSIKEMEKAIDEHLGWLQNVGKTTPHGYFVGPAYIFSVDLMLLDMNLSPYRTSNFFTEFFGRVSSSRYATLPSERKQKIRTNHKFYFSFNMLLSLLLVLLLYIILF
eukprot:TRINITY_DN10634_c0_g1_i1.p1 TRINITY_DN10634_c0_g1~~TRINITY_DN10634_c0_g1_i1.p1  ORF type:complete len:520 (-),score=83.05 TRINITY_DN10634_c0_g1_i1:127-1686(-)